MPAWFTILLAMAAVVALLNPPREDWLWFLRLRRPAWLTIERWIPLIWSAIYACFYASALLAWNAGGGLGRMAGYLGLLVLVQSYTWMIGRTRRLASGTIAGLSLSFLFTEQLIKKNKKKKERYVFIYTLKQIVTLILVNL